MDLRRHSQCHRRLFIALIISLLSNVYAKHKETPMPSTAPSISESPSYLPSATPSFRPSLTPSSTPSMSLSPSQDPTGQPTPTPFSAPTLQPTPSPSSAPSTSEAPTAEEEKLLSVPMPNIGITFFLNDDEASSSSILNLDTEVTAFLQNVLAPRCDDYFEYLSLDYEVTQFAEAERRRLKTGVSLAIEGMAFYAGTDSPPTEDIAELLKGYFSFWGIQDLEDHLHATLPSAQDVQVYIDGSIVEVVTDEEDPDGDDKDQVRASVQTQGGNDDPPLEAGGIAGVVVGSLILITAISLAVFHGQKKRHKLNRQERRNSPSPDVSEVSEASAPAAGIGRIGATPAPGRGYASSSSDGVSTDNDGVSTDNSLYTSSSSIILSPTGVISPNSYDPKRLDKVIAAAKQHSDEEFSFVRVRLEA